MASPKPILGGLLFLGGLGLLFGAGEPELDAPVSVVTVDSVGGASIYFSSGPDVPLSGFGAGPEPKAFIVHVDPRSDTLTAAARDSMAAVLAVDGWEVEIRSLYDDEFDPVAAAEEVSFQRPAGGEVDPLVAEYQDLVDRCDALILVYPLWWKQPPAMLKGWLDRVFTYGFAYEFVDHAPDSVVSLLPGKKVLIVNVVASSRDTYEDMGYLRYLDMADRSLYGTSGMELVERHIIYSATAMNTPEKAACLEELSELLPLIEPAYR